MPSVFRSKICLPPLFYEVLREVCGEEGVTATALVMAYQETFGEAPTSDQLAEILSRLTLEAQEAVERGTQEKSDYRPKKKQTFASSYAEYLQEMDVSDLCFLLANFNPELAKKLYCSVDTKLIEQAGMRKVVHLTQDASVAFEAVLFGMGGHYKGAGPNDKVIDLTEDANAAREAFQQLGLM